MAIALTVDKKWDDGKAKHVIYTVTFSGNYAAGGDEITSFPESLGDTPVYTSINNTMVVDGALVYMLGIKNTNKHIVCYETAGVEYPAGAWAAALIAIHPKIHCIFARRM